MSRLIRAGAVLCAIVLAAAPAGSRAASQISVGYIPVAEFIPNFVGVEKGFYAKYGLEVTLVPIPLASNVPAALLSGSVQIGMTTTPIFLQARENGIELAAISGFARDTRANPQLSLLARKGSGIAQAKDLEGKKVAVPGLNSLFDTALKKWMIDKGADPKKVSFSEARMPTLADILRGGNVDAITIIDPYRTRALGDGTADKVSDYFSEMMDNQILAFWIVAREWGDKNPSLVDAYRKAMTESIAFVLANAEEAQQIGAKNLKVPISSKWPNWSTDLAPADFAFQAKMESDLGVLKKPVDTNVLMLK